MKKIKVYESVNQGKPKLNDWVILRIFDEVIEEPAQIIQVKSNNIYPYMAKFPNTFDFRKYNLESNTHIFSDDIHDLVLWSDSKEELLYALEAEKFML